MKDYKLIRVLNKLNKKDLRKLKLFMDSPYFNFKPENISFFHLIMEEIPSMDMEFRPMWESLSLPPYTDERLRKKLHECLVIVEQFLIQEEFQQKETSKNKVLLEGVVNRNIDDLIPKSMKQLKAKLDDEETLTYEYYSNRYFLYNTHINLPGFDRKIALKKNKDSSEYLLKADKILNEIFLSEKLRLAHLLSNDNSVSNKDDQLTFIDEVYEFANKTARRGSKPHFYMQLIGLSSASDKLKQVDRLHNYVSNRSKLFSTYEFRTIILSLINEAIRISNQGSNEADKILFKLWQSALSNKIIFIKSELLPDTFRNISFNACKVGEYDWALDFIQNYQDKLNPIFRETAVAFNKARVYINQKQYNRVIETLRDVEFDDITYNLNTRLMLLVSYFELDEFDALDSLIKSFNVYLRRKTNIPNNRKSSFKNFNSSLQDIMRVKERRDKVKLKVIRQKLESKMIAPNKGWLMEKVEELETQLGVNPKTLSSKT